MSMFPTELAAESNTQNVRTPKKHQKDPKGIAFQRLKKRQYLQII